jgi:hypothetical protein
MVASCWYYAEANLRNKSIIRLSNLSKDDLRQISKTSLREKILGFSFPFSALYYSDKAAERCHDVEVARDILKYGTFNVSRW